jgi:hypothetical protein
MCGVENVRKPMWCNIVQFSNTNPHVGPPTHLNLQMAMVV